MNERRAFITCAHHRRTHEKRWWLYCWWLNFKTKVLENNFKRIITKKNRKTEEQQKTKTVAIVSCYLRRNFFYFVWMWDVTEKLYRRTERRIQGENASMTHTIKYIVFSSLCTTPHIQYNVLSLVKFRTRNAWVFIYDRPAFLSGKYTYFTSIYPFSLLSEGYVETNIDYVSRNTCFFFGKVYNGRSSGIQLTINVSLWNKNLSFSGKFFALNDL